MEPYEIILRQATPLFWIILILFVIWLAATRTIITGHWHHTFDDVNFSALEYYQKLDEGLKAREVPGLSLYTTTYRETVIFGAKRTYMRIRRGDHIFEACAAPFGTGMYASWWFVNETTRIQRIWRSLPIISFFYTHITYHQIDTEQMFQDLAHMVVLESLDAITENYATRMTEYERRIQSSSNLNLRARS